MMLPVVYDPMSDLWVRFRVVTYGWPSVMKSLFFVSVTVGIVNRLVRTETFKEALKVVSSNSR